MSTSLQPPGNEGGSDKHQTIPKILLVFLVVGLLIVIVAIGAVLKHNHGGAASGSAGQPADQATGPHLGANGTDNGTSVPAGMAPAPTGAGQGGGPGAMGSGVGAGGGTPGTAASRPGGVSSGTPAAPSTGASGTAPP